jgi:hypothetical protein
MAAADTLPFVEKTSLFGTTVHAVIRAGTPSPDVALREALAHEGFVVHEVGPVVPSLDDVFLDVVDRA